MTILTYLESRDGKLKKTALESLTAAKTLAEANGGKVHAIMVGATADMSAEACNYGSDQCHNVSSAALQQFASQSLAQVIADTATQVGATTVLFANDAHGKEIAPRVAVRLEAGFVADAVELQVEGDSLVVTKPVYAGKARVQAAITTANKVVSIRPNVFNAKATGGSTCSMQDIATDVAAIAPVTSTDLNTGKLDVAEADIIVSGGRGLKGPENFNLIEDLANVLGAAVGASRAVVDAGWRPHGDQVGQTGKTVSPNLYIACAISGAVQHLAGMSSSKVIVAINKDKEAPIFSVADYGIVGDVFEVLPTLTEKVKAVVS